MTDHATTRPLAYAPDIEQPKADEAEAIKGIIDAMTQQSEIVAGRTKHAVRASHAKSTGLAVGRLTIASGLPPDLAQGLFAAAGTYDVAVRFAQGAGEILPDKISTHCGMAIKVFGVSGEKLDSHSDDTQDFVLATGKVSSSLRPFPRPPRCWRWRTTSSTSATIPRHSDMRSSAFFETTR